MLFRCAVLLVVITLVAWSPWPAAACPFCEAVRPTLHDNIDTAAVAVISLYQAEGDAASQDREAWKSTFSIERVIKGQDLLGNRETLRANYGGTAPPPGSKFLVLGNNPPVLDWQAPNRLTPRGMEYLNTMLSLPRKGTPRLLVALKHLEDPEELQSRDAYDEFAAAPYAEVRLLAPHLDPDDLVKRISNPALKPNTVRLYCTLLGVCGKEPHAKALEAMLKSGKPHFKPSLDAMIAAYLRFNGAAGLPLVQQLFLSSDAAADRYKVNAAINALRFHGEEGDIISQAQVLEVMRTMLRSPHLAAPILADLARWAKEPEDWRDVDRVVELFEQAKGDTGYVRFSAAEYLVACPLPEAKDHVARLEKLDPRTIQRARQPQLPEPSMVWGGSAGPAGKKFNTQPTTAAATAEASSAIPTAGSSDRGETIRTLLWNVGAPLAGGLVAAMVLTWILKRRPSAT